MILNFVCHNWRFYICTLGWNETYGNQRSMRQHKQFTFRLIHLSHCTVWVYQLLTRHDTIFIHFNLHTLGFLPLIVPLLFFLILTKLTRVLFNPNIISSEYELWSYLIFFRTRDFELCSFNSLRLVSLLICLLY